MSVDARLGVSVETVLRNLIKLEGEGRMRNVHSRARPVSEHQKLHTQPSFEVRAPDATLCAALTAAGVAIP